MGGRSLGWGEGWDTGEDSRDDECEWRGYRRGQKEALNETRGMDVVKGHGVSLLGPSICLPLSFLPTCTSCRPLSPLTHFAASSPHLSVPRLPHLHSPPAVVSC